MPRKYSDEFKAKAVVGVVVANTWSITCFKANELFTRGVEVVKTTQSPSDVTVLGL